MSGLIRVILGAVAGYAVGVAVGAVLISIVSGNTHDKSLEIAMTAAFVTGPIGSVLGLIAAILRTRRSAPPPPPAR